MTYLNITYLLTGVAQVVELSNQLRGRCGKRQVPNARVAMQHNIGIGGACVVALYRRADGNVAPTAGVNSTQNGGQSEASGEFKSDVVFEEIKERAAQVRDLKRISSRCMGFLFSDTTFEKRNLYSKNFPFFQEKDLAKKAEGSYRFTITSSKGNTKSWTVDLKKSPPYVGTEGKEKVDVELILKGKGVIEEEWGVWVRNFLLKRR